MQRDPAGVAAHHLDHEHAVVRLGRGVQPVDRLHRDVDRGVEAEGEVGGVEVVVDRLGDADHVDAEVVQLGRHSEGVLASDGHQRVDAEVEQVLLDLLHAALDLERVGARGAEDGAAAREDAAHLRDAELAGHPLQRSLPAVAEPDELEAVLLDALADDGPDDRVQTGTVASSGEHSDAHGDLLMNGDGGRCCRFERSHETVKPSMASTPPPHRPWIYPSSLWAHEHPRHRRRDHRRDRAGGHPRGHHRGQGQPGVPAALPQSRAGSSTRPRRSGRPPSRRSATA